MQDNKSKLPNGNTHTNIVSILCKGDMQAANKHLRNACLLGDLKTAQAAIAAGADINAADSETGLTPLHLLCCKGNNQIISKILGNSSSFAVIKNEYIDIIELLFVQEKKPNINAIDKNGKTFFYFAVKYADNEIRKALLKHVSIIKKQEELYCGCLLGDYNMVKKAIDAGANISVRELQTQLTALHLVCNNGDPTLIASILKIEKEIFTKDIKNQYFEIAKLLFAQATKPDINVYDNKGYTPFCLALMHANDEIVNLLLQNITAIKSEVLVYGCLLGDYDMVKQAIETGADINQCSKNTHASPLYMACCSGNKFIVSKELSKKAFKRIKGEHLKIIQFLFDQPIKPDINIVNVEQVTPLQAAIQCADNEIVDEILNHIPVSEKGSVTPFINKQVLLDACLLGNYNVVKKALDLGLKIDVQNEESGLTPLHLVCLCGNRNIVQAILGNVEIKFKVGQYFEIAELLFREAGKFQENKQNKRLINKQNKHQETPMHIAARYATDAIISNLLTYKPNMDCVNSDGQTPLMVALENHRPDIAMKFLSLPKEMKVVSKGQPTVMYLACSEGQLEVVKELVEKKIISESALCLSGFTPLSLAAKFGHKSLVEYLVLKVNVNFPDQNEEGYTPLMHAARNGYTEIVKILIAKGANIIVRRNSAIAIAEEYKRTDTLKFLKQVLAKEKTEKNSVNINRKSSKKIPTPDPIKKLLNGQSPVGTLKVGQRYINSEKNIYLLHYVLSESELSKLETDLKTNKITIKLFLELLAEICDSSLKEKAEFNAKQGTLDTRIASTEEANKLIENLQQFENKLISKVGFKEKPVDKVEEKKEPKLKAEETVSEKTEILRRVKRLEERQAKKKKAKEKRTQKSASEGSKTSLCNDESQESIVIADVCTDKENNNSSSEKDEILLDTTAVAVPEPEKTVKIQVLPDNKISNNINFPFNLIFDQAKFKTILLAKNKSIIDEEILQHAQAWQIMLYCEEFLRDIEGKIAKIEPKQTTRIHDFQKQISKVLIRLRHLFNNRRGNDFPEFVQIFQQAIGLPDRLFSDGKIIEAASFINLRETNLYKNFKARYSYIKNNVSATNQDRAKVDISLRSSYLPCSGIWVLRTVNLFEFEIILQIELTKIAEWSKLINGQPGCDVYIFSALRKSIDYLGKMYNWLSPKEKEQLFNLLESDINTKLKWLLEEFSQLRGSSIYDNKDEGCCVKLEEVSDEQIRDLARFVADLDKKLNAIKQTAEQDALRKCCTVP